MSIFSFKHFSVDQRNCAMKINTDGVLIGVLAHHPCPKQVLDIGTGTGVIALMLAQRYPDATITGVEIDENTSATAGSNFALSDFAARLSVQHIDFKDFTSRKGFDLIVSNPPFFVNDLKSEDELKSLARHTDNDFYQDLMERSASLLNEGGVLWLVLPPVQAGLMTGMAAVHGLSLCEIVNIRSFKNKVVFRNILCFSNAVIELKETDFVVYASPGTHSEEYNLLLREFFLNV